LLLEFAPYVERSSVGPQSKDGKEHELLELTEVLVVSS
jgi:hypothetical protein